MSRQIFTLPDDMDKQLKAWHDDTGIPIAALIRQAIADALVQHRHVQVASKMSAGGYRPTSETQQPAQLETVENLYQLELPHD